MLSWKRLWNVNKGIQTWSIKGRGRLDDDLDWPW